MTRHDPIDEKLAAARARKKRTTSTARLFIDLDNSDMTGEAALEKLEAQAKRTRSITFEAIEIGDDYLLVVATYRVRGASVYEIARKAYRWLDIPKDDVSVDNTMVTK